MATKKKDVSIRSSAAEYLTFVAATGESNESVEMRCEDENIWLTQKMMAVLYDVDIRTINEHIKRVFSDRELPEDSTIRKFRIVQTEGTRQVTRDALHYNLNMIKRSYGPDNLEGCAGRKNQGIGCCDRQELPERIRTVPTGKNGFCLSGLRRKHGGARNPHDDVGLGNKTECFY